MTEKTALEWLKVLNSWTMLRDEPKKACEMAINALEKQIEKNKKGTIKYLEGQEEPKHYIQFHEKVVNECEHIVEYLTELKQYKDKEDQGLLIELPCKVGDTVYVYNYCDYVCTSRDWETGIEECPFENECEFEECKEGNERLFKTAIDSIWNNGQGWEFSVRGLHLEISINAIGKTVFLTRSEAEEALARMKGE